MHIQFNFVQQCIQISTRINSTSVHTYICVCFIRNMSSIRIYILIDPEFNSYHPQSNRLVERQNRTTTNFLLKNMDCQDDWVDMIPMMMGSHRHIVHSMTNIEPSAILLGQKPTFSMDMLLRSDDYLKRIT